MNFPKNMTKINYLKMWKNKSTFTQINDIKYFPDKISINEITLKK